MIGESWRDGLQPAAVDIDPDPEEAARRLRAAMAYVGASQADAAKALGVSIPTLARMVGKKGADGIRPATWSDLWRAADAFGLPRAWFTADMSRIHQIVPDDMPRFPNDVGDLDRLRPTAAERSAAAAREAQALQREALRSSSHQPAASDTKRSRRRRRSEAD